MLYVYGCVASQIYDVTLCLDPGFRLSPLAGIAILTYGLLSNTKTPTLSHKTTNEIEMDEHQHP